MISTERTTCRLCGDGRLSPLLDLGNQYLVRFVNERDDALPKSPLALAQCDYCSLLQLTHTVDPDLLYRTFWYRSGINETMRSALRDVVDSVMRSSGGNWLDIGANDGYLLAQLPGGWRRVACEPARNFTGVLEEHCHRVVPEYFSADVVDERFDVISSIAMFYDLDDPNRFVGDIVRCLKEDGVWVNQLNDAPTMMRANAVDGICHEHLCYYDLSTLERLYARHGLTMVEISSNDVNGGSIRVVAKKTSSVNESSDIQFEPVKRSAALSFAGRALRWKKLLREVVESRGPASRVWGYGASTKGCAMLQFCEIDHTHMHAIADRNPMKHGLMMPGSWIPIRSEEEFRKERGATAIVFPYSFRREFDDREAQARENGTTFIYPLPDISYVY